MIERIALIISMLLGIISVATVVFYAGYNFKTLQGLRKTMHELNVWRQDLMVILDTRYVRADVFGIKLDRIDEQVTDIHKILEQRSKK
jgi:hypothetical protein